jgi:hypothetical protein
VYFLMVCPVADASSGVLGDCRCVSALVVPASWFKRIVGVVLMLSRCGELLASRQIGWLNLGECDATQW